METTLIPAIYSGGVFRPIVAPNLPDGATVEIQVVRQTGEALAARWQRRMAALARAHQLCSAIRQRRGGVPMQLSVVELVSNMRDERDAQIAHANHRH